MQQESFSKAKDLQEEALISEVQGLQLARSKVKAMTNRAELEAFAWEKDFGTARETLYNNQLTSEKDIEKVAALREAVKAKDASMEKCKIQQMGDEKAQQQKIESLQQELEICESAKRELLLALERGQRAVTAVEDLREKQPKSAKAQENCWRGEREKLNGLQDLVELKRVHEQELETKVSRAYDAIRQGMESRADLQKEVSELEMQLQSAQTQLRNAELALGLLGKAKKDEVMTLSNALHDRLMDLETSQVVQHQKTITVLNHDLAKSHELYKKVTFLEKAVEFKEEEVHALSLSQEQSKPQLKALQAEYRKDTYHLVVQLDKALAQGSNQKEAGGM